MSLSNPPTNPPQYSISEIVKELLNLFKGYQYYAGNWHETDCDFTRFDEGVCNCSGIWDNKGRSLNLQLRDKVTDLVSTDKEPK